MDNLNSDIVINIIPFLNVIDHCHLSTSCRRMCYLVDQFQENILGPDFVTSSSALSEEEEHACGELGENTNHGKKRRHVGLKKGDENCADRPNVLQKALYQLRARPRLAFLFSTQLSNDLPRQFHKHIHKDAAILTAYSPEIQSDNSLRLDLLNTDDASAAMIGSFSKCVSLLPFHNEYTISLPDSPGPLSKLEESLLSATPTGNDPKTHWKVFIVYSCGRGNEVIDTFVTELQRLYPECTIVGGICGSGFLRLPGDERIIEKKLLEQKTVSQLRDILFMSARSSMPMPRAKSDLVSSIIKCWWDDGIVGNTGLREINDGIFGMAMGGEVPLKCIVSRGVKSLTSGEVGNPVSGYTIASSFLCSPGDELYPYDGDHNPIHFIKSVQNTITGKIMNARDFLKSSVQKSGGKLDYVGVKRREEDGFDLNNSLSIQDYILVLTDGSQQSVQSMDGSHIDAFSLNGSACLQDLDLKLSHLNTQTKNDKILGAIMFSCSARGPSVTSLIPEELADVRRFKKYFPSVPCVGFYADGEIGPVAKAGKQDSFQSGQVAVQGYTAVFALFIVPVCESNSFCLDDGEERVAMYMQERLQTRS